MSLRLSLSALVALAFALLATTLCAASPARLVQRQAPNTGFAGDPLSQTASLNMTSFVIPLKKDAVQKMVGHRALLPVKGLPQGYLKDDEHPLVLSVGKLNDIRQIIVQIQELQIAMALIPFVDATGDGQTPFTFNRVALQDQLVPVLAGSLQQLTNIQLANFNPAKDAFRVIDDHDGQYAYDVNQGLPKETNVLGLPVPNLPSLTAVWNVVDNPQISEAFYKGVAQAPYIHTYNGLCSRTKLDFDQSFAQEFFVEGDIQTYPPVTPSYVSSRNVQGAHVVAGWNNEFGPGKPCESYKDFAQSIKYE